MSRNEPRIIQPDKWNLIKSAYEGDDDKALIEKLLALEVFPIKDSYVAFLRTNPAALNQNHATVQRLACLLRRFSLAELHTLCSRPKETNRQLGSSFKKWVTQGALGLPALSRQEFLASTGNAVLVGSDKTLLEVAKEAWGYRPHGTKGLDFVCRMNGHRVIGEAKFITATGGNQNNQFKDVCAVVRNEAASDLVKVGIIDGVIWLKKAVKDEKLASEYASLIHAPAKYPVMSALFLKDFLLEL